MMYYGTGGTTDQMQESLTAPMYRPKGYDCAGALGGKWNGHGVIFGLMIMYSI